MSIEKNSEKETMSLSDCLGIADETKELVLKPSALKELPALLENYFRGKTPCIIADTHTMGAAGSMAAEILKTAKLKLAGEYIFPGEPRLHAEYDHVRTLAEWCRSLTDFPAVVPVAVGAGTINDIVKCLASELGLPYLCIPTAASVDGFTSNGAALLVGGFKQTLPCPAPLVLAADTGIISGAPAYLSSSGFGDLAGKIIAGTDWIIAEKAGEAGAPEAPRIDKTCWTMIQTNLTAALEASSNAARGNGDAVNALFQALSVTGFSMQYYKDSRPVSGSEHLLSHVWEMEDLSFNGVPVTHGHKVTIGTLAMTAFTGLFFANPAGPPETPKGFKRPSLEERRTEVSQIFKGNASSDSIVKTAVDKFMNDENAEKVNQAVRDSWKELRERVLERLVPYAELKKFLQKALCPVTPEETGLERSRVLLTARKAQMIRNKYGILDLAWDMGNFERILEKIEDSEIYLR